MKINTLLDIAYQSPLTGGDAVISARVILGIDPDVENERRTKSEYVKPIQTNPTINNIRIFPNPANNILYIVLDNSIDGMSSVDIFDLTGKVVYRTNINATLKLKN